MRRFVCLLVLVTGGVALPSAADRAEDVWAAVLAAKGGVERLQAVRSVVVETAVRFQNSPIADVASGERTTRVDVFPDRSWAFVDHRPGSMGVTATVWNGDLWHLWSFRDGQRAEDRRLAATTTVHAEGIERTQYIYFLQTRWVRPQPLTVARAGNKTTLKARWKDWDLTYRIDRRSNLPASLDADRDVPNSRQPSQPRHEHKHWEFADYTGVGGIQLPKRVRFDTNWGTATFQVNPEVDPDLFEHAPVDVHSPDDWKRPTRSPGR
jgi:hypothetical protein